MNIIFVLIPIAILFVIIAGVVFFWAIARAVRGSRQAGLQHPV